MSRSRSRPHPVAYAARGVVAAASAAFLALGLTACLGDDNAAGPVAPFTPPPMPTFSIPEMPTLATPGGRTSTGGATTATARATPSSSPSATRTTFERGQCLHGTINTGGRQEQLDVVPCSSSKADFRVLRVFGYSMFSRPCDAVSGTDYVYSSYYTLNGLPTSGSTYCLQEM